MNLKLLITPFLFIILLHVGVQAQEIAVDGVALNSGSQQKYTIKSAGSEITSDSTQLHHAASTAKETLKDSLKNHVNLPGTSIDSAAFKRTGTAVTQAARDSLNQYIDIPDITIDSTTTEQVKAEARQQFESALEEEIGIDLPAVTIDSTTTRQVKDEAVRRGEEALKDTDHYKAINGAEDSELGRLKGYKDKLERTQEELRQATAKQQLRQKMASNAQDYMAANANKIQQVQSQMAGMKKKFSYLPNSNDLSTAVKRESLQGESFWKRLVIGGNFNISKTNPLNIDLSPVLGYKINKLFEAGITGFYRSQLKADRFAISAVSDKEVYGYSAFANHMTFRNFFGYIEAERIRMTQINSEEVKREWKQTLLIGLGRKFNVTKWLEMQALILFNVLHDNKDGLYNGPVVFKTALRVRK